MKTLDETSHTLGHALNVHAMKHFLAYDAAGAWKENISTHQSGVSGGELYGENISLSLWFNSC